MGSEELAANLFRITQTESRLKRDNIDTEKQACDTHNKIGKIVRKAIKQAGRNNARRFTYSQKESKTIRKRKQFCIKKA
jgi:DNA-damage-inducible protein D